MTNQSTEAGKGILTASFDDRGQADAAYTFLLNNGYHGGEINLVMSDKTKEVYCSLDENVKEKTEKEEMEGLGKGAVVGGGIGAVVGTVAGIGVSALIPGLGLVVAGPVAIAAGGAAAAIGSALGALYGSGVPAEEAKIYDEKLSKGSIMIGVTPHSEEDAELISSEWVRLGGEIYC